MGAASAMRTFQMQSVRCVFFSLGYAAAVREFFFGVSVIKNSRGSREGSLFGWLADYLIVYALPVKWRKKCSSLFWVFGCNERLFHTQESQEKTSGLGINVFDVSVVVAVVIIIAAGWCEITP